MVQIKIKFIFIFCAHVNDTHTWHIAAARLSSFQGKQHTSHQTRKTFLGQSRSRGTQVEMEPFTISMAEPRDRCGNEKLALGVFCA